MHRIFRYLFSAVLAFTTASIVSACEGDDASGTDGGTEGDDSSNGETLTTAYSIVDTLVVGRVNLDDSCDLNGNGKANNAVAAMLNAIPKNLLPDDPDETIAEKIASGESLMVVELEDVQSFENDDILTVRAYKGLLDDPDAGQIPDGLFSGHSSIAVELPANSVLENATISDGLLTTPESTFQASVPLGNVMMDVELQMATLSGSLSPAPNEQMLDGKVPDGKICGAVDAQRMIQLAKQSPDVPAILKPLIGSFITPAADLECDGKPCLSIGMRFTAVSIQRKD